MIRRCWLPVALLILAGSQGVGQEVGRDAVRSLVTIIGVDGISEKVILDAPRRFEAPDWTPDGSALILNAGGKLWRLPVEGGGPPQPVPTGSAGWIDINHGISPDGKTLAVTVGPIALLPASGGEPRPVSVPASYFQSWSPDGKTLAFTANRGGGFDLFATGVDGGPERRLTSHPGIDDTPAYSPDGRQVYFNSDRSGGFEVWRMPAEGAGPGDARAERITDDGPEDWSPHPSPDGKWLIFLSYPRGTKWHPPDRDVAIRRMPLPIAPGKLGRAEEVVRLVGGHGSLGARPWSPDGRRFAFVRHEPPPPTIRVVFFTPADLRVPAGVARRLGRVADAAERFLVDGMKRTGYPPAVEHPFRRNADGSLEILYVKGDRPAAAGAYARPDYAPEVIRKATERAGIAGEGHVWWIFIYLGDPPTRFGDWRGNGTPEGGGWAMVNYDTIPGEILPDLGLAKGFNAEFALKGTIHELCHAFGLPHIGPDPSLKLGNSLMGPNNSAYAGRRLPGADRVYLDDASAAMLWKHPIFSGQAKDRATRPPVKLADFKRDYDRPRDRVTLSGRVASDRSPHSVVVLDDRGLPQDDYWNRGVAARVAADGTFKVAIDRPAHADGHHRITFCFDNGQVLGDGPADPRGETLKAYRFRDGRFQFDD